MSLVPRMVNDRQSPRNFDIDIRFQTPQLRYRAVRPLHWILWEDLTAKGLVELFGQLCPSSIPAIPILVEQNTNVCRKPRNLAVEKHFLLGSVLLFVDRSEIVIECVLTPAIQRGN